MWLKLALSALSWVMDLFGVGKPDPVEQGERLGKAEVEAADAQGELADVQKASDARASVSDSAAGVLDDPNNVGPARHH